MKNWTQNQTMRFYLIVRYFNAAIQMIWAALFWYRTARFALIGVGIVAVLGGFLEAAIVHSRSDKSWLHITKQADPRLKIANWVRMIAGLLLAIALLIYAF